MPAKKAELQAPEAAVRSEENLKALFKKTFGEEIVDFAPLKGDASARRLFRIKSGGRSVIGAIGPDRLENTAFVEFSKHFKKECLPVPEIYAADLSKISIWKRTWARRPCSSSCSKSAPAEVPASVLAAYKKTLDWLPDFQMKAGKTLDYKYCHRATVSTGVHNVGPELF